MTVSRALVPILVLVTVAGARTASAQSVPRLDVAAQATLLRLSDPGSTSAGVGGRMTFDLSRWIAVDGEANFYPHDDFTLSSSAVVDGNLNLVYHRRRSDAFVGMKIGVRGERFGLFAKARPGFARLGDKGVECRGDVCAFLTLLFAPTEYRTEFALDLGGIVEYYPTARTFARVDLGDMLIRHRSAAPPCGGCTTHNFTTRLGFGLRF
jgi:hypothetical protein